MLVSHCWLQDGLASEREANHDVRPSSHVATAFSVLFKTTLPLQRMLATSLPEVTYAGRIVESRSVCFPVMSQQTKAHVQWVMGLDHAISLPMKTALHTKHCICSVPFLITLTLECTNFPKAERTISTLTRFHH